MKPDRRSRRGILDGIAGQAPADAEETATFMRGLALGALVGAAIAGSTLWNRRRDRRAGKVAGMVSATIADDVDPRSRA